MNAGRQLSSELSIALMFPVEKEACPVAQFYRTRACILPFFF